MIKPIPPLILIQLGPQPSIAAEGNFYFLEYLELKLFRFNLNSHIKFEREDDTIPERFHETSEKIQEVCSLLEHLYPKLYVHVSRQLKITLRTEIIICDIFRSFCRTLFKMGITWPRIVALFAFASGVIVDCIREGRVAFARTVVYCVKAFIEDNLTGWIKDQGGWEHISEHFQSAGQENTWRDVITWFPGLMWSLCMSLLTGMENSRSMLKSSRQNNTRETKNQAVNSSEFSQT